MDRCSRATRTNGLIMERISRTALLGFVLLCVAQVNGYSKYGRTCKDIGCRSTEVCVMAEDPCPLYSRNDCGRYPICKLRGDTGGLSCTTMICPSGQYCKTENGRPTCVNTDQNLGYDSAGISSVNGQRTSGTDGNNRDHVSTNTNPYANANAPPLEEPGRNYPVSSGTNLGYPPYPSGTNNNHNGNSGSVYPPYPPAAGSGVPSSSGTNLGYPPYPTQNRMPMPGQTGVYQQHAPPAAGGYYPGNSASGYPPNQQYPGHSNYPYQNRNYNSNAHYPRPRSSAPRTGDARAAVLAVVGLALVVVTKYLS